MKNELFSDGMSPSYSLLPGNMENNPGIAGNIYIYIDI